MGAYVNISSSEKKLRVSQDIYEDSRFLMEKIVKEVRTGTIDYEEYWNKNGMSSILAADQNYSDNYGEYAKTLINPGYLTFDGSDDSYGTRCVDAVGNTHPEPPCPEGYKVDSNTIDKKVGINPYDQPSNPTYSNAMCYGGEAGEDCTETQHHIQEELYLINAAGNKKTIIKRIPNRTDDDLNNSTDECSDKDTGLEHVGILQFEGSDTQTKSGVLGLDGIIDTWTHAENFDDDPQELGCNNTFIDDFVTLTSPSIEVTDLKFIISPLEDPRKAYRESTSDIQNQPHVTIILKARASSRKMIGIRGARPEITIQTTVSTRILNEVSSF